MSSKYHYIDEIRNIPTTSGVYCIYNKSNNKRYIGFSKNMNRRLRNHIGNLSRESTDRKYLYYCDQMLSDWRSNKSDFEFSVLEETQDSSREVYWTLYYQSNKSEYGYNQQIGRRPTNKVRLFRSQIKQQYHKIHHTELLGSRNFNAVLSESSVKQIKKLLKDGISVKEISQKFGVSLNTIYSIRNNKTWNHVSV